MALLIERTQNINWEEDSHDVRGDLEEAANLSKLVVVGKIVSDRLFNKPAFWEIVLKSWRYVDGLEIEDMSNNTFLFTRINT